MEVPISKVPTIPPYGCDYFWNLSSWVIPFLLICLWTTQYGQTIPAVELSPRVVFTKQTQWQGLMGPLNLRGYGFPPGRYHPGIEIFKGIPYAGPPVNQLRFESPSTITLFSNKTYFANETKGPCPRHYESLNIYRGPDVFRKIQNTLAQEALEDCLYMDIYVPRSSNKNPSGLPVLVYANSHPEDEEDPFDGSSMAAIGNLIVVTFRYRVGVLGFLHPSYNEETRTNFGLWDQLAALQWIRENINGFGGDENNVCLMGSELDAAFSGVLALSPFSQVHGGLFQRIILLNGSPTSPLSINNRPLETTAHMARALNCPLHEINGELIRCLRQRQLDQILGAAHSLGFTLFKNHFAPSVDRTLVKDFVGLMNSAYIDTNSIKEALGKFDVLCGLSEDAILPNVGQPSSVWQNLDMNSFVTAVLKLALQLDSTTEPPETLKDEFKRALIQEYGDPLYDPYYPFMRDILVDFLSVYPMIKLLNIHSQSKKNTFFYVSKNYNPLGKTKKSDISYIFSSNVYKWKYMDHGQPNADLQPYDLLITFIANFVRFGDPNVYNPRESSTSRRKDWPKYRQDKGNFLKFGREVHEEHKYRGKWMEFWLYTFPEILKNNPAPTDDNEWDPDSRFGQNPNFPFFGNRQNAGSPTNSRYPYYPNPPGKVPASSESSETNTIFSSVTQNTVVMVGGFLLALNLLCFIGLFYQRQRLKRSEHRLRRRQAQAAQNSGDDGGRGAESSRGVGGAEVNETPAPIPSSDLSETYAYIGPGQSVGPSQSIPSNRTQSHRAPIDTLSETETDNGFGTDFLGPNYDPRTKVTRWMFHHQRNGGPGPEEIPMTSLNPPYGTLPRTGSAFTPAPPPLGGGALMCGPFQPNISDLHYADSSATTPSVLNFNYKVQTPPLNFNNNLSTNNFNNPRRSYIPSPSNSGTTTLSNPDSQQRRSRSSFIPLRHSVIVQELDPDDYGDNGHGNGLIVTEDQEVQSSRPKLVPVKTGTLTRSVGVGDTNHNADEERISLLPPSNPSPSSSSSKQGQKVTFADQN